MDALERDIMEVCEFNEFSVNFLSEPVFEEMRRLSAKKFRDVDLASSFIVYNTDENFVADSKWARRYLFEFLSNRAVFLLLEIGENRKRANSGFKFNRGQEINTFLETMYGFPYAIAVPDLEFLILEGDSDFMAFFGSSVDWARDVGMRIHHLGLA